MNVAALMTEKVHTCVPWDTLDRVARIMWEGDIGAVPVVDDSGKTTGMITDRDLCMAAYTQGKPLSEIPVWVAASSQVIAARPDDTLESLHDRMRSGRVRRVPVVGERGEPIGVVTLGDLARRAADSRDGDASAEVARTLAFVVQPRAQPIEGFVYRVRPADGVWDVFDGHGARAGRGLRTQGDAVAHAKELARRHGSAQIIVYDGDRVASEFFYQTEERSALAADDAVPTLAASRPARARSARA